MKVKLAFGERVVLPNLLPREGAYLTVLISKRIIQKIEVTDIELEQWGVRAVEKPGEPGVVSYTWDRTKAMDAEFEFSDAETEMIRMELNKLEKENKLNFGTVSLFEKFCNPSPA